MKNNIKNSPFAFSTYPLKSVIDSTMRIFDIIFHIYIKLKY